MSQSGADSVFGERAVISGKDISFFGIERITIFIGKHSILNERIADEHSKLTACPVNIGMLSIPKESRKILQIEIGFEFLQDPQKLQRRQRTSIDRAMLCVELLFTRK
jgi:hypothetical protein